MHKFQTLTPNEQKVISEAQLHMPSLHRTFSITLHTVFSKTQGTVFCVTHIGQTCKTCSS